MKGFIIIATNGEASDLPKSSTKRTGEGRLALVEKTLKRDGIEFVEDFYADNRVIVRYGDYTSDALWAAEHPEYSLTEEAAETEPALA